MHTDGAHRVKRDLVRLGLQRQLLSVIGRNTSDAFAVILRKVLRCCEALPLTAEDVHGTRSAHGSLGDMLRELTQHTDGEVRKRSYGLLRAHPVGACVRPSSAGGDAGRGVLGGELPPPLLQQPPPSPPSAPPPSPPLDAVIMVRLASRQVWGDSAEGPLCEYLHIHCLISNTPINTHTPPQRPLVMDEVLGPTPRVYMPAQHRSPSPDRSRSRPAHSPRRVSGWDAPTRYQPRGVVLCSMRSLFEEGAAGQLVGALGCDRHRLEQPPPPPPPPEDDHAAHYGTVLAPAEEAAPLPPAPSAAPQDGVWDVPDAAFESFVAELVKRRLGKYCQPDHPTRISQSDADTLYAKIKGQVVAKERDAYAQRQATGAVKPIMRDRLEAKVRDFVRESIKRYLAAAARGA